MLKKITVLLLVMVMVCTVFFGCTQGDNGQSDNPTDQTTTAPTQNPIVIPTFTTAPKDDGKVTYTVTILDQNNNPVPGVSIQFCDEENCKMPVDTDANGVVTAKYAPSEYHITLVGMPEGYTSEELVFYFGEDTDLTVVITAG